MTLLITTRPVWARIVGTCVCVFAAMTSWAADPLLDNFNTEKNRIAEQYKSTIKACQAKVVAESVACKQSAARDRQLALKAASAERDAGLKCRNTCGLINEVRREERDGKNTVAGEVVGGVAGAVVGRKLADGSSNSTKNVATVAGAVGGAVVGRKVEQKLSKQTVWTVAYTLYDGTAATSEFDHDPGFKAGDHIKLEDGKLSRR
ncbi:MAG: glycine zipper 2TM domain-containing protein [Burkholderiales bacterium]|nr:glycine zipper 2TM domain-containing protein [Burkholderiales bacterium]